MSNKNIRHVGNLDMDLRPVLARYEAAFHEGKWRQAAGSAHSDSEMAPILMPEIKSIADVFNSMKIKETSLFKEEPIFRGIIGKLADSYDAQPARAMLVRLKPGGSIAPHIDEGPYAEATDRYHLAIETNALAWLKSGEETQHIPMGQLWAFNKHVMHSAGNAGSTPRTHLIIDLWKRNYGK